MSVESTNPHVLPFNSPVKIPQLEPHSSGSKLPSSIQGPLFKGKGWRPGECLLLKGTGTEQKLPREKGCRAQPEWSEAWKFWQVLIPRDLRPASWHTAQEEPGLKNVCAASALRGYQPNLTRSQRREPTFREVPSPRSLSWRQDQDQKSALLSPSWRRPH